MARAAAASETGRRRGREIELYLPSELGWERAAMDLAASVAGRMGFSPERIDDIKTAVAEATINAIEHGHAFDASQKVLVVLIPDGGSLEINVRDRSTTPFKVGGDPSPDLGARLAGTATARGWGVFLIRQLMDEVEFASTHDGNVVRMVVHLER